MKMNMVSFTPGNQEKKNAHPLFRSIQESEDISEFNVSEKQCVLFTTQLTNS